MTRYKPTFTLASGSHNLAADTLSIQVEDSITHMAPKFSIDLDNRNNQYGGIGSMNWGDPVVLNIASSAVPQLKGRIDQFVNSLSKKGGQVLTISGRGDFGALEDIESNLYFVDQPMNILTGIISEYNSRKQSRDPTITIAQNLLPYCLTEPYTLTITKTWKQTSLARMIQDLCLQMGAPFPNGISTFYDCWVDGSDNLYCVPCGYLSSSVTVATSTETLKANRYIDANPVRTDIWLIGNSLAGAIPVTMSAGYVLGASALDTWTEDVTNPAYAVTAPSMSIATDSTIYVAPPAANFGSTASIKITYPSLTLVAGGWYLDFPNGKWAAQNPNAVFNTYNETTFSESMGQVSALNFWIRSNLIGPLGSESFSIYLDVFDNAGTEIVSAPQTQPHGNAPGYSTTHGTNAQDWIPFSFPFGPSASGWTNVTTAATPFDWSSVAEIMWRITPFTLPFGMSPPLKVWMDGLSFTKPLVVSYNDTGTSTPSLTTRTEVISDSTIASYAVAQDYLNAELLNVYVPQVYWDFENVGRADILTGKTFTYGSTSLLAREQKITMSKRGGWQITVKGYEALTL